MGVFAVIGHRSGVLVGMVLCGCFPKEDLDSYSGSGGVPGGAMGGSSGMDAGVGGAAGNLPDLDAAAGSAGAGGRPDATVPEGGAGGALTDAGEPVSDAGDAGVLAAQCASTGGTLEPGTRDCLFVAAVALSWQNAVNACNARQSTLVAIKTPERDAFITSRLTATVWVGARDAGLNPAANAFTWLDGTSVTDFTNWAMGEPDAVADQFCVAKTLDTAAGPWRDRPCSELNAYVCEQRL